VILKGFIRRPFILCYPLKRFIFLLVFCVNFNHNDILKRFLLTYAMALLFILTWRIHLALLFILTWRIHFTDLCDGFILSFSVKFVGLFVVLLIGFSTAADLWRILGDLTVPVVTCSLSLLVQWKIELFGRDVWLLFSIS